MTDDELDEILDEEMKQTKRKAELKRLLSTIKLPGRDQLRNIDDPTPLYDPILEQLNVKSKDEINELRIVVSEKIDRMSQEIQRQTMQDFLAGKYKSIEDVPLYRKQTPQGVTLTNIPEDLMIWASFVAWLNEESENMEEVDSRMLN